MKRIYKRIVAYLIDILIVSIIITLVLCIPIFKTERVKYNNEYAIYMSFGKKISNYYQDKKIDEDEYANLKDKHPSYIEYVDKYFEDKIISKKEYKKLVKDVNNDWQKEYKKINYKINKYTVMNNIVSFVVIIVYFLALNVLLCGQTIGKKLVKLKIVNVNEDEKISTINNLIRIVVLYNPIYYLLVTLGVFIFKANDYYSWSYVISQIKNYLEVIIFVMIVVRKDRRGLHELLSKTKVIATDGENSSEEKDVEDDKDDDNKKKASKQRKTKKDKISVLDEDVDVIKKKDKSSKTRKKKKVVIDEE